MVTYFVQDSDMTIIGNFSMIALEEALSDHGLW
jgi:hypothetical protein